MKLKQTDIRPTKTRGKRFRTKKGLIFLVLIGVLVGIGCITPYQASSAEPPIESQVSKNITKAVQETSAQISEYIAQQKAEEERALKEQKAAEEKALAEKRAEEEAKAAEAKAIADAKAKEEAKVAIPATIPITTRAPNDLYPNDKEVVATLSIPSVGIYQPIIYGDSQENIDNYEVVIRNGHFFGQNGALLLAGHNYKTFGRLVNISVGSVIYIHSYYGDFTYTVERIQTGITDGSNVITDDGQKIIDHFSLEPKLHMYTCHGSDPKRRLVVTAHPS